MQSVINRGPLTRYRNIQCLAQEPVGALDSLSRSSYSDIVLFFDYTSLSTTLDSPFSNIFRIMGKELATLKQPVAIRPEHVCSEPTTFRVRQHCLSLSFGDFSVSNTSEVASSTSPSPMFTVDGKVGSWTQRRAIQDASGLPVFDMRRKKVGATWTVELPGGSAPLATLAPRRNDMKDRLDVYVHGQEEVLLEVRGLDVWKKATHVYLGNRLVMDVKLVNLLSVYVPFFKDNQWDVRVSQGMDPSLVSKTPLDPSSRQYATC